MICINFPAHQILVQNLKTGRKYPPLGAVGNSLCGIELIGFHITSD